MAEAKRNENQIPISELRKSNRKKTPGKSSTEIPFVVLHHPRNHRYFQCHEVLFTGFTSVQNVKGYHKGEKSYLQQKTTPNLINLFTRAKFTSTKEIFQVSKCDDSRFGTRTYIQTRQTISFQKKKYGFQSQL